MLRRQNPFNSQLLPCTTFSIVPGAIDADHALYQNFIAEGGASQPYGESSTLLTINHSKLDGLGAFYLLEQVLKKPFVSSPAQNTFEGEFSGFRFLQTWAAHSPAKSASTFTQRFISKLLGAEPSLSNENIGFVVNLATPILLNLDDLWGNGIAIDVIGGRDLMTYSEMPKEKWRRLIQLRATKTLKLIGNSNAMGVNINSLVISSIGDLTNLAHARNLSPANFLISATPISEKVANLILWARNGQQCLSLCASPGHWALRRWENLLQVWGNCE